MCIVSANKKSKQRRQCFINDTQLRKNIIKHIEEYTHSSEVS